MAAAIMDEQHRYPARKINGKHTMHKQISRLVFPCVVLAGTLAAASPSAAQEEPQEDMAELEDTGEACVNTRRISRTRVVDDRTIIFYMRGGLTYVNILPRPCNGLAREDRFSYQAQSSRLCDIDGIVVLYQAGTTLRAGANCRLGLFHEISRDDAAAIIEGPQKPPPNPLPMPEPEEIGESDDESEST